MKAGARGYLLKSDARRDLISAIESLTVHKPYFTAKVSEELLKSHLSRFETDGIDTYKPRARRGPTGCRRTHEQERRWPSQHKPQDGGDTPRDRHAQAQSLIVRRSRALCDPEQDCGGVESCPGDLRAFRVIIRCLQGLANAFCARRTTGTPLPWRWQRSVGGTSRFAQGDTSANAHDYRILREPGIG